MSDLFDEIKRSVETVNQVKEILTPILEEAVTTDGEHHKQWYLERLAQLFGIDLPEHEQGTPP